MPAIYTREEFIRVMEKDIEDNNVLTVETIKYGIKKYGSLSNLYDHYIKVGSIREAK